MRAVGEVVERRSVLFDAVLGAHSPLHHLARLYLQIVGTELIVFYLYSQALYAFSLRPRGWREVSKQGPNLVLSGAKKREAILQLLLSEMALLSKVFALELVANAFIAA